MCIRDRSRRCSGSLDIVRPLLSCTAYSLQIVCTPPACAYCVTRKRETAMQIHISSSSFLNSVPSRALSCQPRKNTCIVSKDACRPRCLTAIAQSLVTLPITAQDITPEAFAPFGQVNLGYFQPFACECCLVFTMLFAEGYWSH